MTEDPSCKDTKIEHPKCLEPPIKTAGTASSVEAGLLFLLLELAAVLSLEAPQRLGEHRVLAPSPEKPLRNPQKSLLKDP